MACCLDLSYGMQPTFNLNFLTSITSIGNIHFLGKGFSEVYQHVVFLWNFVS